MRKTILRILGAALCGGLLAASAPAASAYDISHYASRSAMASGRWVKIRVDHEGLYEITYDQLRQWGFDKPEAAKVYGFGGTMLTHQTFDKNDPDDLNPTVCFHTGTALRFYGVGAMRWLPESCREVNLEQNLYSNYGYYFVTDIGTDDDTDTVRLVESGKDPVTTAAAVYGYTEDVENPVKAGGFFLGRHYDSFERRPFQVPVIKFAPDAFDSDITANIRYAASFSVNGTATLEYDTEKLQSTFHQAYDVPNLTTSSDRKFYLATLKEQLASKAEDGAIPDTTFTFTFGGSEAVQYRTNYLANDYVVFSYPQTAYKKDGEATIITFVTLREQGNFSIQGCSENTQIYDVTYSTPRLKKYATRYDADTKTMTASFDRIINNMVYPYHIRLLVVDPGTDAVSMPEYVGETPNQDIHGDAAPDLLIITTDELYDAACELAQAHRDQGMAVNVYTQQQVFNEFTSGTPDIAAYRRVLKMFRDRDNTRMKYLLLYGRAIWDNRQIVEKTNNEVLLCYENASTILAGNLSQAYVGDGVLGVLADDLTVDKMHVFQADVAVGRIPADNLQMAQDANAKVIGYMTGKVPFINYTRGVFVSDDGDGYTHLKQTETIINRLQTKYPAISAIRVHNDIYPWTGKDAKTARTVLSDALTRGVGLFFYVGHGTPDGFTGEKLWTRSFATSLSYKYPPLVHLSTCDAYAFDHRDSNIAEAMFFKKDGGSIGVIAACRAVYMQMNQEFATRVADSYGDARYGATIGDIYLDATNRTKKVFYNDDYTTLNTCCYNLLGDPAVKLPLPLKAEADPKITAFDDVDVSGYQPMFSERVRNDQCEIVPGTRFTVTGGIEEVSINGTADVTVFQSPRTVQTLVQNSSDRSDPRDVVIEQDILAETTGKYQDGHATIGVVVPQPMTAGEYNRIVLTLTDENNPSTGVAAVYDAAYIDDNAPEVQPDYANAPSIEEFYLDTPGNTQDATVGKDFTIHATIKAPAGFNVSSDLGAGTRLVMDHNKSYHDAVYNITPTDDPEVFSLSYAMADVADGRHVLTLDVADNTGARASMDLSFVVMSSQVAMTLLTDAPGRIVRDDCTFDVSSDSGTATGPFRLIIRDADGNTVLNTAATLPYTWDFKGNDGQYVADGQYTARILSGDADNAPYGYTDAKTITILRRK